MALNRACIGREYPPVKSQVSLEAIERYARACNETNCRYYNRGDPREVVAPPLFGATLCFLSVLAATGDPEVGVDVTRLVHGEQEMEFYRPIHPGDEMISRSRIATIETRATGEAMAIELELRDAAGDLVQRAINTVFIRGRRSREGRAAAAPPVTPPSDAAMLTVTQTIDLDQTTRYAEASGDRNPIHLDDNVARMVGLPGIIVHGLCTMAFVARVIVDGLCGHDPARLRELRVRFARPVRPGDSISTTLWPAAADAHGSRYFFETRNQAGQIVISDGTATVALA
jgi:acyl dehydratase